MKDNEIRLLNYNVDTNIIRAEEGYAKDTFSEWRANERAQYIQSSLDKIIKDAEQHPHIIQLQEGRTFRTQSDELVDSVSPVKDFLIESGYEVIISPYNAAGGDKAFKFVTAFDPNRFELSSEGSYMRYLSKTNLEPTHRPKIPENNPEQEQEIVKAIKDNNFGAFWERGVLITPLLDKNTKQEIYSINVHLDVGYNCRINSSELILKFVKEILNDFPDAKIVISGDFNTFPDWGGPEQLAILKKDDLLSEASETLQLEDGSKVDFSFIAYPYDFAKDDRRLNLSDTLNSMTPKSRRKKILEVFDKECSAIGGKLDHVYNSHGLFATNPSRLLPAFTTEEKLTDYSEASVKKYILNMAAKNIPAFASDHQPMLSFFQYKENDDNRTTKVDPENTANNTI